MFPASMVEFACIADEMPPRDEAAGFSSNFEAIPTVET
jgi:hypothetical protein